MKRSPLKRKTPLKRSGKLRPVSKKRAGQNKVYSARRREFLLKHLYDCCPVMMAIKNEWHGVTDVHHVQNRESERLNDVSQWMAVSREGHIYLHNHPNTARMHGWLK